LPWRGLLVVVQIVHINGMAIVEPERYSPVARDGYGIVPPKAALEGVQPETGEIHALWIGTLVEGSQDTEEFRGVPWCNSW